MHALTYMGMWVSAFTTGQVCRTIFLSRFVTEEALSDNDATVYEPYEPGLSLCIIFYNLCLPKQFLSFIILLLQ